MRRVSEAPSIIANRFDGLSRPGPKRKDKIVRRKFGQVAKVLWEKPDAVIGALAKKDPRTGRRILRGEGTVPWTVVRAAIDEMLRPLD
jgi:hypothetical protein